MILARSWTLIPGDSDDQVTIAEPATPEQVTRAKAGWLAIPDGIAAAIRAETAPRYRTEAPVTRALDREWEEHWLPFLSGQRRSDFRFRHLGDEDRATFEQLHADGNLTIGFPGSFPIAPWFMAEGDWEAGLDE
jgi:hypothetical protein